MNVVNGTVCHSGLQDESFFIMAPVTHRSAPLQTLPRYVMQAWCETPAQKAPGWKDPEKERTSRIQAFGYYGMAFVILVHKLGETKNQ